jgi:hypothetical protein
VEAAVTNRQVRSSPDAPSVWPSAVWELGIDDAEGGAEAMLDRLFTSDWPSSTDRT